MTETLPTFPVDEITLEAVKHSLNGAYEIDDDGNHILVGAEYSLTDLLGLLSGYDPSKLVQHDGWAEYPGEVYSERCVISALIAEVERLRSGGRRD